VVPRTPNIKPQSLSLNVILLSSFLFSTDLPVGPFHPFLPSFLTVFRVSFLPIITRFRPSRRNPWFWPDRHDVCTESVVALSFPHVLRRQLVLSMHCTVQLRPLLPPPLKPHGGGDSTWVQISSLIYFVRTPFPPHAPLSPKFSSPTRSLSLYLSHPSLPSCLLLWF